MKANKMTLVKCTECKKDVSSTAKVCPHCGKKNPMQEELSDNAKGIIGWISLIITGLLMYSCISLSNEEGDAEYSKCVESCNMSQHITGPGKESINCYSSCDRQLRTRKENKAQNESRKIKEYKAREVINTYVNKYEKHQKKEWTTEQHKKFLDKLLKKANVSVLETTIGRNFVASIGDLIESLYSIDNTKFTNDILVDRNKLPNNFVKEYLLFNKKNFKSLNNEKVITNILHSFILQELDKIIISEPVITNCPDKIDYTLTNNSAFNIKYIKFGTPDFRDYRFTEFVNLRESLYYELDRVMSSPSFIFSGDNRGKTIQLTDTEKKTMAGKFSSEENMRGTYRKAYDILLKSDNIFKFNLGGVLEMFCFVYKKPVIREILFTNNTNMDVSAQECLSSDDCKRYKEEALNIYNITDYAKTKKDKSRELEMRLYLNVPANSSNRYIRDFYEGNKDIFTIDYLLYILEENNNQSLNNFVKLKEKIQQIYRDKTKLENIHPTAKLSNDSIDFIVQDISFNDLLNVLNPTEMKEFKVKQFISKFSK